MKRFVLIALVLALFAAVPACAADLPVFAIEKDGVVIGTAVMVGSENTFLTTAPISREDQLFLAAGNEKLPLEAFVDTDGLLSLVFTETPVPGTPLTLGPLTAEDISATGFLPDGTLVQGDCRHISYVTYPNGATLTTLPSLLPGAVLTGADDSLCGLITASLGEGEGRYFALDSAEIYSRLSEEDEESAQDTAFIPCTATVQGSQVHLDWSEAGEAEGTYNVYWRDTANRYYVYHSVDGCTDDIICVPGRSYLFCVRKTASEDEDPAIPGFPEGLEPVQIPDGGRIERYGFKDTAAYLAFLPDQQTAAETDLLAAVTDYASVFAHEGFQLYFQLTSTYEVTEELYADLVCVLYAPDGSCYSTLSGFVFAPEYMPEDTWHMDVTELFDECSQSAGELSGTYSLAYYLDGQLASEITFDIP